MSHNLKSYRDYSILLLIGESPSSSASASDLDNLNNPAAADKAALVKGVNQAAGNHVIAAKNKPSFTRILNFVSVLLKVHN
ncbi:hypothetical protein HanOQP8_Chr10g0354161 [Helianthus annuus]|nr:hypothetical protein HanOQP8_Chr10g0354161 [Helianthus annuus]